jgi:branched-chain amino acid transport system ATP-binding protein
MIADHALLQLRDLHAFYGNSHVLHGVNLEVGRGEIVSVLGRNGSGRSTTALAIMGAVRATGTIRFNGEDICGLPTHVIARKGIGVVAETRDIFADLTVFENLCMGLKQNRHEARFSIDEAYRLFPRLKERANAPAGALSGGEQQLLTMCRTLLGDPDLVIVDEPTEGLSPATVDQIAQLLVSIASRGIAILLIEQKLTIALDISPRLYVMGHGQIVFGGTVQEFEAAPRVRREWLEV